MKTKTCIILIVAALAAGYVVGALVGYPLINSNAVKGTVEASPKLNEEIETEAEINQTINEYMALCYLNQASYDTALSEAIASSKDIPELARDVEVLRKSQALNQNVGENIYALMSDLSAYRLDQGDMLKILKFNTNLRNSLSSLRAVETDLNNVSGVMSDFESYIKSNRHADTKRLAMSRDLLDKGSASMGELDDDKVRMDYLDKLANEDGEKHPSDK